MLTRHKNIFFQTLSKLYPNDRTDLVRSTPWQLLVAVVMSAQTTDKQVNKMTEKFFDSIKTPYDTLQLTEEQRYKYIKWVNYAPTKARNLYKTAQILVNIASSWVKHNGIEGSSQWKVFSDIIVPWNSYAIPNTLSELIKLHGVGEKTAKVILHVLYRTDDIAVDTHVHRVCNRIGLVNTKEPLQTSKLLDKVIPKTYKSIAHHSLVFFWRYQCTARKPKCQECPFTKFCHYYNNGNKK